MTRKCDCLNDCGDDPALRTGEADWCEHSKRRAAAAKAAQTRKLNELMRLADNYADAFLVRHGAQHQLVRGAREALKAKIKELIDAKV